MQKPLFGHKASESDTVNFEEETVDDNKSDDECTYVMTDVIGEKDEGEYPENTWRAWVVILGCVLLQNMTYGMVTSYGVYQIYYQNTYSNISDSTISLVGSLQPSIMFFSTVPVVWVISKIGVTKTIIAGSFFQVLAYFLLSICNAFWQIFLTQGILVGIGGGLNYMVCITVPTEWFKKKRALALGVATAGASIGGITWPVAVQRLIQQVGFGWANKAIAFIVLAQGVVSALTVKERIPKTTAGMGIEFGVVKNAKYLIMVLAISLSYFGYFPPMFFVQVFAMKSKDVPDNVRQYILTILNSASLIGRILSGFIGDKVGRLNILIVVVIMSGIFPFALWVPQESGHALLICFAILWGASSGGILSLFPSTLSQLFGVNGNSSRLSLLLLFSIPACMSSAAINGTFLENKDGVSGFNLIGIFCGTMFVVGGTLLMALRLSYTRKLTAFI